MADYGRSDERATLLGDIGSPAPATGHWVAAAVAAALVHAIAALPFLPEPEAPAPVEIEAEGPGIGVRLAPLVQPPEEEVPPEPEPEPETPAIEERAEDSPPPAPPRKPREAPDLPDIRPRAVPDLWRGSGEGGNLSIEEYLYLKDWLDACREEILSGLSYPEAARRAGESGAAQVEIVARRDGSITGWKFRTRTGSPTLDREITRTIDRIRRLPRFPEGVQHEELSFIVPIRFELVFDPRDLGADAPAGSTEQGAPPAPPTEDTSLSAAQLSFCARAAADLSAERDAIEARRAEIEALGRDYEEQAERYHRERREPPLRVRNMLRRYEAELETYDGDVASYRDRAAAFSSQCGSGAALWEPYAQACRPYVRSGNRYCEAFGPLWARLRAE